MVVRRLFKCCETFVERFLKDFLTIFKKILERLLNDCYTIVKRLFNDG